MTGISYPYVIISDVHCHNWSQFSYTNESGINNRLKHILDGIRLAVADLRRLGGNNLIITGDLFHTRGSIKPSVLNPVYELFKTICDSGINIHAIPGNHDLEGEHSNTIGNALHTLGGIDNFHVYSEPTLLESGHFFIPWMNDYREVLNLANKRVLENPNLTLFCHIGLNDVIPGIMSGTIDPKDFLKHDYKYVFSGHFHNHASFDSRVYSVGALCHYTWNDVGSLAGYLIVHEDKVTQHETFAPKFIDITSPPPKMERMGNYFRIKGVELPQEAADEIIKKCKDYGAIGVVDHSVRTTIMEKTYKHHIDLDLGVDKALATYCDNNFGDRAEEVYKECLRLKS